MRAVIGIALGALIIVGCERIPGTEANRIAKGEQVAASLLIDPSSAQFRKTVLRPGPKAKDEKAEGPRWLVCGEINGKNRSGAYVGFGRFVADPDSEQDAYLEPTTLTTREDADRAEAECHRGAKGPIYSEADRDLRLLRCQEAREKLEEVMQANQFNTAWDELCVPGTQDADAEPAT